MADDGRLNRLLDYTKFHIGIYLSATGAMVGLLAAAAKEADDQKFLGSLFAEPWALAVAAALMATAGAAGGIIATCCTQYQTFEELWNQPQGPHKLRLLKGEHWALIEHGAFWLSFAFLAFSVLSSQSVLCWLSS